MLINNEPQEKTIFNWLNRKYSTVSQYSYQTWRDWNISKSLDQTKKHNKCIKYMCFKWENELELLFLSLPKIVKDKWTLL